ncbi:MAG: plastocyanin/azurin family copper-binding protein [Actinomycetota bacterium]
MRSLLKVAALAVAASLLPAACGNGKGTGLSGPESTPTATGTEGEVAKSVVTVGDIFFRPKDLTVKAGKKVVWEHEGRQPHSVTADDGAFDSHPDCPSGKCMQNGDRFEFAFTKPGRYAYYCRVHGGEGGVGQSGVITVE